MSPDRARTIDHRPDPSDGRERQSACIRLAQARLAAFVESSADDVDETSDAAVTALRSAVSSGADLDRISAELEVSTGAIQAIVDGSVPLRSLHPDDRLRPD
ncbi:hypothetical protein [Microbacterium testaceum]|uniref:hypothetical protein n=1 Tax=Microbacterium testaceum TaxID=2033 RepID=UPI0024349BC8|nr:hypothetical protein [Microbacterium testaceum]